MKNEYEDLGPSGADPHTSSGMTRRDLTMLTAVIAAGVGVLGAPAFVRAAAPATVSLPAPKTDGKVSVAAALKQRRSVRNFAPTPLTLEDVGRRDRPTRSGSSIAPAPRPTRVTRQPAPIETPPVASLENGTDRTQHTSVHPPAPH